MGQASFLLSWHWDLFPISIEAFVLPQLLLFYVAFSSPFCFLQHWVGHLDYINFVLDFALVFRNHTLAASAQLFPARLPLNWKYSLVNWGKEGGSPTSPRCWSFFSVWSWSEGDRKSSRKIPISFPIYVTCVYFQPPSCFQRVVWNWALPSWRFSQSEQISPTERDFFSD